MSKRLSDIAALEKDFSDICMQDQDEDADNLALEVPHIAQLRSAQEASVGAVEVAVGDVQFEERREREEVLLPDNLCLSKVVQSVSLLYWCLPKTVR